MSVVSSSAPPSISDAASPPTTTTSTIVFVAYTAVITSNATLESTTVASTTADTSPTLSDITSTTVRPDNNAEINWIIIGSVLAIVLVSFGIAMFCVISIRRKARSAKQNRAGGFFPGSNRPSGVGGASGGYRGGAGGGPGQMPHHAIKGIPG